MTKPIVSNIAKTLLTCQRDQNKTVLLLSFRPHVFCFVVIFVSTQFS